MCQSIAALPLRTPQGCILHIDRWDWGDLSSTSDPGLNLRLSGLILARVAFLSCSSNAIKKRWLDLVFKKVILVKRCRALL